MFYLAVIAGKLVNFLIQLSRTSSGSTWPGYVARLVCPQLFSKLVDKLRAPYFVVSGTNGKTTTTALTSFAASNRGTTLYTNFSGSNLRNGLITVLLKNFSWFTGLSGKRFLLEVDENTLNLFSDVRPPAVVCFLNLFRDQLDRYAELDLTAKAWRLVLQDWEDSPTLLLNADDPLVASLGKNYAGQVHYFGCRKNYFNSELGHGENSNSNQSCKVFALDRKESPKGVSLPDNHICPFCRSPLEYEEIFYSHQGVWVCSGCGWSRPELDFYCSGIKFLDDGWSEYTLGFRGNANPLRVRLRLQGKFLAYNITAAIALSVLSGLGWEELFLVNWPEFVPAFGRQEEIRRGETLYKILLSKNPVGFTENLELISRRQGPAKILVLGLNDDYADGRDISWIYDVDFSLLGSWSGLIYVFGQRYLDLQVCLKYHDVAVTGGAREFRELMQFFGGKEVLVLPTYTAMLEVRQDLVGRKIL